MSNVTAGFDEAPSSDTRKDEDGDDLHSPHYDEKVSCDDGLFHGDDPSRKKARLEGPGDDAFKTDHANSSTIKGMHEGNVHGLDGVKHEDPSINAVLCNVNAEIGQSFGEVDTPSQAFVSATHTHCQSIPSQTAFDKGILGEHEYGNIPADAASGIATNFAVDGTSSEQFSENTLAFDGMVPHESPDSHTSYKNGKEIPCKGSMDGMSEGNVLHGHSDVPESPITSCLSGWHAGEKYVAGLNSHSVQMIVGKPPYEETLPSNGSIGRYTQEKAFPLFGFLHSSGAGHTLAGDKGESAQFSFQGTIENFDNNRFFNNAATIAHEESSMYNQPGGEDLKVNLEHITLSSPAKNLTRRDGSLFSGSSYYGSQSVHMKNLALILRFGAAIVSLIAFSVIISTSEKRVAAGSTFYVKFSDYQAYNYLAALNLLTFLYSSGQLILLARGRTSRILSSPIKWGALLYLCDQVLAFLMVSSSSSAATASELSHHGLHNIWPPACSTWKLSLFCSRADVAVAMSFFSCLFMFLSTFSSGYHLANLLAE